MGRPQSDMQLSCRCPIPRPPRDYLGLRSFVGGTHFEQTQVGDFVGTKEVGLNHLNLGLLANTH